MALQKKELIKVAFDALQDAASSAFSNWEQGYIAACGDPEEDRLEMLQAFINRIKGKKAA